jgi:hypothetical protein
MPFRNPKASSHWHGDLETQGIQMSESYVEEMKWWTWGGQNNWEATSAEFKNDCKEESMRMLWILHEAELLLYIYLAFVAGIKMTKSHLVTRLGSFVTKRCKPGVRLESSLYKFN